MLVSSKIACDGALLACQPHAPQLLDDQLAQQFELMETFDSTHSKGEIKVGPHLRVRYSRLARIQELLVHGRLGHHGTFVLERGGLRTQQGFHQWFYYHRL